MYLDPFIRPAALLRGLNSTSQFKEGIWHSCIQTIDESIKQDQL